MPRTTRPVPARANAVRAHLLGGNGTPQPEAVADRLARVESLLVSIQRALAVQFQRIADMQVQIDRAVADRTSRP